MLHLDIHTIALFIALISALQVVMLSLCYVTAARYPGLIWWTAGGAFNAVGWLPLLLPNTLPDSDTIVVANMCLALAITMLYRGLNRFLGLHNRKQEWIVLFCLVLCGAAFLLFSYILPNAAAREIIISAVIAIISGICAWNLWRIAPTKLRISDGATALFLTLYSLWHQFHAIVTVVDIQGATLFPPTLLQTATILITFSGILLWTAGLVTMVIQRLHSDFAAAQEVERHILEVTYQHIRAGEQLFRQAFDQSPFGAAILDMHYRFIRTNHVLCTLVRENETDLLGVHLPDIVHPDDQQNLTTALQKILEGQLAHVTLEQRWISWKGDTIWVEFSARLLERDPDATPTLLMQVIDSTARKQAEEALRERETMLQAISDNLPDVVVYQMRRTPEGYDHFPYISVSLARISGVIPEQVYANPSYLDDLREEGDLTHYQTAVEHSFRTLEVLDYEMKRQVGNGATQWSHIRARPRRLADGSTVWDGIEVDITNRKAIETDLRQRIDELVSLNRITQVLAGWTNLPESLKSVAIEVQSLFHSAMVAIWVYEGDHTLRRLISLHTNSLQASPDVLAVSKSALAQRLYNRETVLLIEATNDPLVVTGDGSQGEQIPQCVLLVPLVTRGESFGIMRICSRQTDKIYTPADVALAQTIAAPIATALENARLLTQLQTSAAEAERRRLGRELHDSVSQALFAAHRVAEVLPRLWELDPEEGWIGLGEIRRLTESALAEMRALLLELHPKALRDMPLHIALPYLLQGVATREAIRLNAELDETPVLPPQVQIAFYRIAQEALNNVSKHARAQQVVVRLSVQPPLVAGGQGDITLSISDDGQGFHPEQVPAGRLGLASLYERANEISATLTLVSKPGNGTSITVAWQGFSAEAQAGTYASQAVLSIHHA